MQTTEQPVTDSAPQSIEDKIADKYFGGGEEETPETVTENAAPESEEQPPEQTEVTQTPDDSEDVDFEGVQLKLPKEAATKFKSAVEGYKDYTKKTQELAEHRRVVAAQGNMLQEQQAFQASIAAELSQFHQIDAQIAEYRKLDWTSIPMEQAMQYRMQFDALKDKKEQLGNELKTKQQQFVEKRTQQMRAAAEASMKAVKAAVANWDDKHSQAATKVAVDMGYTEQELTGLNLDPRFVLLAHEAAQWRALQASKPSVNQRANTAPPIVRPGVARTQPNQQVELMNFRKAVKNAPDPATRQALIMKRLEGKV